MGCKFKNRCPSYSGWCEGINYPMEHCISYILDDYENEKRKPKTWNGSTIFQKRITG